MSAVQIIIIAVLIVFLLVGGACFSIFIEMFRSEISDYIKACSEAKRNQNKRFKAIERALEEWRGHHDKTVG